MQRAVRYASLGIQLGENIIVMRSIVGRRKLGHNSGMRGSLEDIGIKLHRPGIILDRSVEFFLAEVSGAHVAVIGGGVVI